MLAQFYKQGCGGIFRVEFALNGRGSCFANLERRRSGHLERCCCNLTCRIRHRCIRLLHVVGLQVGATEAHLPAIADNGEFLFANGAGSPVGCELDHFSGRFVSLSANFYAYTCRAGSLDGHTRCIDGVGDGLESALERVFGGGLFGRVVVILCLDGLFQFVSGHGGVTEYGINFI